MPTINENIAELQQKTENLIAAHDDIKNAIISKGGVVSAGDKFSDYPEDIETIKKDLTSISINENGTYRNGTLDTVTGTEYPIEIEANGSPIVSMTVDGKTVQDGTPTPTAPVDVVGVGIKSNNLFDKDNFTFGIDATIVYVPLYVGDGFFTLSTNFPYNATKDVFLLSGNVSTGANSQYNGVCEGNPISKEAIDGYVTIATRYNTNRENPANYNYMLNTGSTPLSYEPYGYYLPTSINGSNDINAYFSNYQSTRQIQKLLLTGEEAIEYDSRYVRFTFTISDIMQKSSVRTNELVCSHYIAIYDGRPIADVPNNSIYCGTGRDVYIKTDLYTTADDFKAYLATQYAAGTPVTVWYVLAEPQTATSSEPLMKIGDYADQLTLTNSDITLPTVTGNNLVDYDLDLKPSSASISYYKLGVSKTITSDTLPIEFESNGSNISLTLNGQSSQASTPTPTNPVDVNGAGEMTRNLFDKNNAIVYKATLATEGMWQYASTASSVRMPCKPNTEYTISISESASLFRVGETSYSRIPIDSESVPCTRLFNGSNLKKITVTTSNDAKYLIFQSGTATLETWFNSLMINLGSENLPYESYGYKIPILNGSLTYNKYLGEVPTIRKIKKLVFDGTENWIQVSGTHGFYTQIGNALSSGASNIISSHYTASMAATDGTIRIANNKREVLLYDNYASSTDFKAYLAQQYANGTPVTIWYVLAAPTTSVVNEPLMKIGDYADTLSTSIPITDTTNIIDVDTTVKPSSISITYNDLNTIGYDEINVDVPNTYTVSDEGKVVNSGTLVAQTAMPAEITANDTYDTTLYNSIVVNVPTGGSAGAKNDVTFYDYDGTIVTSYSKDEFANLSALPANPSHEGLTAQGWNWSLADAKSYVNKYGKLDIGQMYVTDDGKTRIYVTLTEGRISPILQLYLNANSKLDIDWGDGSTHSTFTTTSADYKSERHNYATPGDYVIAITVTTGSFALYSSSTSVSSILWNGNNNANSPDRVYNNSIQKVEIGTGVGSIIGQYAFYQCSSLTSITIPDGVTSIGNYAFQNCYSLQSITIPDSVTSIGQYAFYQCFSLSSITIPDGVTSIGNYAFQYCYTLTSITIPDTVTSSSGYVFQNCKSLSSVIIGNSVTSIGIQDFQNCYALSSVIIGNSVTSIGTQAFQYCYTLTSITIPDGVTSIGQSAFHYCSSLSSITIPDTVTSISGYAFNNCSYMESIKFTSTTPPTVANSNAWTGVPTSCTMLVPINTFAAYTTATNYPNPSSYTYLVFGTYTSGATLPTTSTDNYILIWYASIADAKAETNPITTGNGNEIYARCIVDTSVTRTIDFDNNISTLSGDPSTHPIYTNIKRCTVQDNGTITSYYGDANYVEDGSIGQVMVYIPKFYYKVNIINKQLIDDTHPEYGYDIHEASYSVSNIKYPGYKLHPAFINANGDEVDYVLCSAFEGSTYDTSASAYNTNDAQTVDFTATTGDLLASIGYVDSSGTTVHVKPASGLTQNLTRPNSMTIAKNRGTGWYALTFKLTSAIQMLITVEYGCNSQVNIADGVVSITDNTSYNCASYVGSTVGNTTGRAASTINEINGTETTYTSATTTSVNWRGIENMWGNIWKWVDGINIYGNGSQRGGVPYVCTDMNFSDTNTANYESVGFTVANTDGYVKYFGWGNDKYDWVFMPSTAGSGGASASTTVGDYFYKTANLNGYRAALLGGHWNYSSSAGVFYWYLLTAASYRSRYFGARLMYVPM